MSAKQDQPYFLPYQTRWLNDKSPIKIWEKSRRIGATYVQSYEDVKDILDPNSKIPAVWFTSADESAAKEYIIYCAMWAKIFDAAAKNLGEVVIDKENDIKALAIQFSNGRRINALSSSPKAFRSKGGKVVIDEFAHHKDQAAMWKAAKPSAMWGYPIRILSTHHGKGLFANFVEAVRIGDLDWSLHTTSIHTAVKEGLLNRILNKTDVSEDEKKEWLAREKRDAFDLITWLEEYEVTAQDNRDSLLSYELIASCEEEEVLWEQKIIPRPWRGDDILEPQNPRSIWVHLEIKKFEKWLNSLEVNGYLTFGYDVARNHDLIVMGLVENIYNIKILRMLLVLENMRFWVQKKLASVCLEHPKVYRGCIDSTGMGSQMGEELQEKYGVQKVEPVNFSSGNVRNEMAYDLLKDFQNRKILIPSLIELRDDLHMVKRVVSDSGTIRLKAENDKGAKASGHADRFWMLALANHAAKDYVGEVRMRSAGKSAVAQSMKKYFNTRFAEHPAGR
ncbi:MAG: terminase family protein [Melioribacteraceae bacterium]|nr:terminase family protein [Melioribacteraceae bacterium]MCF8414550.1 terminase family protein [Melioribacteraceae bacterium]